MLLPNLRAKKTEAIVSLFGKGATSVAKELFHGSEPTMELDSDLWPGARLRLVASYKHLGGLVQKDGSLKQEIKARVGAAWQAFTKHRKRVLGSPIVSARDEALLFSSLIESTLYYGAGTWSSLTKDLEEKLQQTAVGMARLMLRPRFSYEDACHQSNRYTLASARIASVRVSVHVERLRHFKSTIVRATPELWAILHYERT